MLEWVNGYPQASQSPVDPNTDISMGCYMATEIAPACLQPEQSSALPVGLMTLASTQVRLLFFKRVHRFVNAISQRLASVKGGLVKGCGVPIMDGWFNCDAVGLNRYQWFAVCLCVCDIVHPQEAASAVSLG